MPADYAVLAPVYTSLGLADFAEALTPRLIDYAQRNDWMGRRILDAGCGTGASLEWLTRRNYITVGVDLSPEMLTVGTQRLEAAGLYHDLRQGDIRHLGEELEILDLVLALDVVNELNSLRDLEAFFHCAYQVLNPGRWLVFDMHTIQGLSQAAAMGEKLTLNDSHLTVTTTNSYDYDRQILEQRYLIFQRDGDVWMRSEGARMLRGYPAQAIVSLLQRSGFQTKHVITTGFDNFEPGVSSADRIIFLAEKH
ncbi:MAG: class I SAM-dependent methyltransferase [Anaerolineae bacterium]|nr:class I SAM-dependent methyltransferase [Anaerolineae bacterium]